jgi:hypothetical protein
MLDLPAGRKRGDVRLIMLLNAGKMMLAKKSIIVTNVKFQKVLILKGFNQNYPCFSGDC